jgi:hypothetical protein
MARFIPGVLGTPNGKVENKVYRQMNGKTFVSNRPDSYNISQTKSAKNSRQAFGLVVQFAKLITASPGFYFSCNAVMINNNEVIFKLNINKQLLNAVFDEISILNIIYLHKTTAKKSIYDFLVNNTVAAKKFVLSEMQFSINFTKQEKTMLNKFNKFVLFTAIVFTSNNEIKNYSVTITKEYIREKSTDYNFVPV